MEEQNYQNQHYTPPMGTIRVLPNATAVLVLGILSIVLCWCYGLLGLIMAIVALALASKDMKLYRERPNDFAPGSYGNLKAGRVCAIIGVVLSAIYVIWVIIYIAIFGAVLSMLPWKSIMEGMNW
jgi:hypothetical protein